MTVHDPDALLELAQSVARDALARGADVAEVSLEAGWQLTARVRLGELELLEEAGRSTLALRILRGDRAGITTTSDLSAGGLRRSIDDALELSDLTQADEHSGPVPPERLSPDPQLELDLHDPRVASLTAEEAIDLATRAERAALGHDQRLELSEGATCSRQSSTSVLVLSTGFAAAARGTEVLIEANPVALDEGGKRRRGSHLSSRRHLCELATPEAVGSEAARRALDKLGARQVPTTEAAVVFEREAAQAVIEAFASAVLGGALWRRSSYLLDRLGDRVASPLVTLVDDPTVVRGLGSRPFDGEGIRSQRTQVVSQGNLEKYLLDGYSARKLGLEPGGCAERRGGNLSAGVSNFYLESGATSPAELLASTDRGLYVTEMMGFGFNPVTGDFSRGASGFWIEDGRVTHPVSEVTISSTLDEMLTAIDAVADDLKFESRVASPTFRVARMTIAGS